MENNINKKNNSFSIKEAYRWGWSAFKENWKFLIGILFIAFFVQFAFGVLEKTILMFFQSGSSQILQIFLGILYIIVSLTSMIVNILIMLGYIDICLKIYDNKKVCYKDLFMQHKKLPVAIFAAILYLIGVSLGLLLLIIPGIIVGILLSYYPYYIVDENKGSIDSLKESYALIRPVFFKMLLFMIVNILVVMLGTLALFVGLLVAYPVVALANTFVYRSLVAQNCTKTQEIEIKAS